VAACTAVLGRKSLHLLYASGRPRAGGACAVVSVALICLCVHAMRPHVTSRDLIISPSALLYYRTPPSLLYRSPLSLLYASLTIAIALSLTMLGRLGASTQALSLPHVSYATAVDLGDPFPPAGWWHPRRKQEVGRRLTAVALRDLYGRNRNRSVRATTTDQGG
jgi:hypothetical protein